MCVRAGGWDKLSSRNKRENVRCEAEVTSRLQHRPVSSQDEKMKRRVVINFTTNCFFVSQGGKHKSSSAHIETRKVVNYTRRGRSQGKRWWRPAAILTRKSFVKSGHGGERLIESPSRWFPSKFPSGLQGPRSQLRAVKRMTGSLGRPLLLLDSLSNSERPRHFGRDWVRVRSKMVEDLCGPDLVSRNGDGGRTKRTGKEPQAWAADPIKGVRASGQQVGGHGSRQPVRSV